MIINPEIGCNHTPARWVQLGFYATAIVFNLCLIAQVLTVGVAYFTDSTWWEVHVWLVRGYVMYSTTHIR